MKNNKNKIRKTLNILCFSIIGMLTILTSVGVVNGANKDQYQPLAPINGITDTNSIPPIDSTNGLSIYVTQLYKWGVAGASGLAVLMIIWGGVGYVTSAGGGGIEEAKARISAAITGLLLALGSYIILNTINKDLLSTKFDLDPIQVQVNQGSINNNNPWNNVGNSNSNSSGWTTNSGIGGTGYTQDGVPFNPNLTAYSPQGSYNAMEGGYESSKPGLDGQSYVRTLDDYAAGRSTYVTLAGDPSQYGKTYIIPSITYRDSTGSTQTLTNVTGYVHDTGSAFTGAGTSHFDVAIGRDYKDSIINNQPFTGGNTSIVGATKTN